VAKLVGGGYSFEFMSVDEVNFIRDKAAEKNRAKKDAQGKPIIAGPWADNYVEMGRKTALRRLFKYLPISIESLAVANAIDGNAVAAVAPLEDVVFDIANGAGDTVDTDTGEIAAQQIEQKQPVTVQQQTAIQTEVGAEWSPGPEEEAAIRAAEHAEAQQQAPAARPRRERGGLGLE